jgi:hypothetical protein
MTPSALSFPRAGAKVIFSEARKINPRRAECFRGQENKSVDPPYCRIGAANAEPRFLLWGDSHADAMMTAISDATAAAGKAGYFAGYSGCPPILGARKYGDDGCARFTSRVYSYLAQNPKVSDVVLVARWSGYVAGDDANLDARIKVFFASEPQGLSAAYREAFRSTVCGLHAQGKRVFVLGPVPEVGVNVPAALAAPQLSWLYRIVGSARDIRVSIASYRERNAIILAAIADAQKGCGVNLIDTAKAMCASGLCEIQRGGRPLYRDGDHLSEFGSRSLMPLFHDVFAKQPQ